MTILTSSEDSFDEQSKAKRDPEDIEGHSSNESVRGHYGHESGNRDRKEEEDDEDEEEDDDLERNGFTEDGDVIERIRSRASMSSDIVKLQQLREKYKEGHFEMSADDTRRPYFWPLRRRIRHSLAYSCCTCISILAATVFAPSAHQLAQQKHKGAELAVLAFSIYLLGIVLGPFVIAPMADLYGRKVSVLVPMFISGIFLCVVANSSSIAAVTVYRFFAGLASAGPVAGSYSTMSDLWLPKYRATAQTLFSLSVAVGVAVPPIFGALLVTTGSYGWRWAAWLGGLLNLAVAGICMLTLDETLLPVVEKSLARSTRLDSGFWGLHTTQDMYGDPTASEMVVTYIKRPLTVLFIPAVALTIFCTAFSAGVRFLLVTTVGEQFVKTYGFSPVAGQCALISIVVGHLFGMLITGVFSQRYANHSNTSLGLLPRSELRLEPALLCGWTLSGGMFIYGWCLRPSIHWIVPMVGLALVGAAVCIVLQSGTNYISEVYGEHKNSAHTADVSARYLFGGVFPLFARQLFFNIETGWAASIIAFIGILLIPIPWILYFYGAKLHQLDPYAHRLEL